MAIYDYSFIDLATEDCEIVSSHQGLLTGAKYKGANNTCVGEGR